MNPFGDDGVVVVEERCWVGNLWRDEDWLVGKSFILFGILLFVFLVGWSVWLELWILDVCFVPAPNKRERQIWHHIPPQQKMDKTPLEPRNKKHEHNTLLHQKKGITKTASRTALRYYLLLSGGSKFHPKEHQQFDYFGVVSMNQRNESY